MSTQTQAKPLFAAKLTPNRSLGTKGVRVVIALVAIMASIPGVLFLSLGAWPIVGFLGLDVVLVIWALSSAFQQAKRYEEITLWPDQLEVKQVDATGKEVLNRFAPRLVKLVVDRDFNERTTGLRLKSDDRDLALGAFLNQDEKSSFAKAFGTALKRSRL